MTTNLASVFACCPVLDNGSELGATPITANSSDGLFHFDSLPHIVKDFGIYWYHDGIAYNADEKTNHSNAWKVNLTVGLKVSGMKRLPHSAYNAIAYLRYTKLSSSRNSPSSRHMLTIFCASASPICKFVGQVRTYGITSAERCTSALRLISSCFSLVPFSESSQIR